uniref:Large ribosomal subunit protein bL9c n=3 Tax=Saccharina TaxID=309357 RepID=A0A8K1W261_9PHAE|nr:50S ribosomal protein L9 [Saccharina japonica]YP_010863441.1 50S ribosomal protein L9 [Saccharina japonica x Saccharina latissima]QOV02321.1 50S ribosomal protein L9 [Saccharina sp. ye-B]UFQ24859.1 50S ribosomal protein L9 [Saccharina sp. Rongfu]WAX38205.1 ribosomal protein L9 [Saccharina japonica cultivar 901]AFC40184.1 50S ribosomal protein L9 [Saccharina japonica]UFQ24997.1 50S ribosomal protein L9 [Saccharina sp. Rongfu]
MRNKTIQVILTKDVQKLGKQGTLIKVKPGYIRNYLIPLKLGKIATPSLISQFELQQKESEVKQIQFSKKCIINKELLENSGKFTITKKISENGIFYGKITKKHILDLIIDNVDLTIDLNKNQLELPDMKELGEYIIEIILTTDVIAKINIEILPE